MAEPDADSMPARAFDSAREEAFRRGAVPMSIARRDAAARRRGEEVLAAEAPDERPHRPTFGGVDVDDLPERLRRLPGLAFLQDSPALPRRRGRAPRRLDSRLRQFIESRGWGDIWLTCVLAEQWDTLVGPDIAAHTSVEVAAARELVVRTTSTAWATNLRMLIPTIMRKLDEAAGQQVIDKIVVRGPEQPSWRHGPRTVRGRGPRDTYG